MIRHYCNSSNTKKNHWCYFDETLKALAPTREPVWHAKDG